MSLLDIVIVFGPNDHTTIKECITHAKINILNKRNIYIISYDDKVDILKDKVFEDCHIYNESIFENFFTKDSINSLIKTEERTGWYLQQLIKLYASFVIPNILDDYLVIDADTIFLKALKFKDVDIYGKSKYYFNISTEYHVPYFEHMNKLHPCFKKMVRESGITHHMIFNKDIIKQIFTITESLHKMEFWKAFLLCVNIKDTKGSGASEYELYFNYMVAYHKSKVIVRKLNFENAEGINLNSSCDYISVHHYMRKSHSHNKYYLSSINNNENTIGGSEILSGETFQELCDITLITKEINEFHKSLSPNVNKIFVESNYASIYLDKSISEMNKPVVSIFIYTHILKDFMDRILPELSLKCKINIVTHNSDHPFDETYLPILNNENVNNVFAQNTFITHSKLISIPIGIANSMWPHGNKEILSKVVKSVNTFDCKEKMYVNISINNYPKGRQYAFECLRNSDVSEIEFPNRNYQSFLEKMSEYKWIACPRGNGVDTHRLWETLYLNRIPVTERTVNSENFKEAGFPIILVDDWNQVNLKFLQEQTKKIETDVNWSFKLKIDYWRDYLNVKSSFVLCYLGNLPHYTEYCLKQLRLWNPHEDIYFCINEKINSNFIDIIKLYDIKIVDIDNLNKSAYYNLFLSNYLNTSNNNLWKYSMERFFVVEECMKKYNLKNVIHLELDNLVYFNIIEMTELIYKANLHNNILIPSDNETRFIAGVCYIPNISQLNLLNEYFSKYAYNRAEMETIMEYSKKNNNCIKTLPTVGKDYPYELQPDEGIRIQDKERFSKFVEDFEGIFDAAAIGQYMFGIDPIHNRNNTDGFINPHCCFKISKTQLKWEKVSLISKRDLYRLSIKYSNKNNWYPVYNLHVHNKSLYRGMSDKITEITNNKLSNLINN